MVGKFTERYKRRSLSALLLCFFEGRAKYISVALIVAAISLPFVAPAGTMRRMLEMPPMASLLRAVGMGGVVSAVNPGYTPVAFKTVLDRAGGDSPRDSFWKKFLGSLNYIPPAGGPSSMALIRGGSGIMSQRFVVRDGKSAGPVKGVVSAEESARGEDGGMVDLKNGPSEAGPLSSASAGAERGGDAPAQAGQPAYTGQPARQAAESAPFMDKTLVSKGGADSPSDVMYNAALDQAEEQIPVPDGLKKPKAMVVGKVSGFTWKNVGYKTQRSAMLAKMNTKQSLFQLAQAFSMTGGAYKSKETAYEYQSTYAAATYDGNAVDLNLIATATAPQLPPDTGFAGDIMKGAQELSDQSKRCAAAQNPKGPGPAMSSDAKKIDDIAHTLGVPPNCCACGAVHRWNDKQDRMKELCLDFNVNAAALSVACQATQQKMDCGQYQSYKLHCCFLFCIITMALAVFMMIMAAALFFTPFAAMAMAMSVAGASMAIGAALGGPVGSGINIIGAAGGGFLGSGLAALAVNFASSTMGGGVIGGGKDKDPTTPE